MASELTLYECASIMAEFDRKAEEQGGELTAEDMELFTATYATSIEKIEKLVWFTKALEAFDDTCQKELDRIEHRRKVAANRLEGIKRGLLPFVRDKKHGLDVGTIHLGIRHSTAVELEPNFNDARYMIIKTTTTPDKKAIAEDLKANSDLVIKGATLVTREHLTIK